MRRVLFFVFFLALIYFSNQSVYAQVVINEFCPNCDPEWVELYNNSDNPVDLEGWEIQDGNTKSSDDLTLTGTINPKSFFTIDHPKGWLNDSGDTIYLYLKSSTNPHDSYTYSSCQESLTFSRVPDGLGNFFANTPPTKNLPNQSPTIPSPTPSPTVKPTSTPTPKPTSTPKPTHTSTPSPSITANNKSLSPTINPTSDLTPSSFAEILSASDEAEATTSIAVIPLDNATSGGSEKPISSLNHQFNPIFIGLGLALLGSIFFIFRLNHLRKKKK